MNEERKNLIQQYGLNPSKARGLVRRSGRVEPYVLARWQRPSSSMARSICTLQQDPSRPRELLGVKCGRQPGNFCPLLALVFRDSAIAAIAARHGCAAARRGTRSPRARDPHAGEP